MLRKGHKANFETLQRAIKSGDCALMECEDAETGEHLAVICAVQETDGEVEFIPIARLFNGNPYDEVNPPDSRGGFIQQEEKE
jgi:hypothetical protein